MPLLASNDCACSRCGLPLDAGFTVLAETICETCFADPPPFLHCYAPYLYVFPLDQLIARMKYQRRPQLSRLLAKLMIQSRQLDLVQQQPLPDLLVPVPMHPKKQHQRGYNQTIYLARHLGHHLGIPVISDAIEKIHNTEAQNALNANQRKANLSGSFRINPKRRQALMQYSHIGVVDDVITTGATVMAVSGCLTALGPDEISAWAIARTP